MRRMHGGSLADRLERGPLTDAALAALVTRIGGALTAAATAGIVHGRLVPGSVLFDAAGDPYLADFALAPGDPTLTAGDDVHDFATMVAACLARDRGHVLEVLNRGLSTVGRPSMAELVPLLVAAITGGRPVSETAQPNPYKGLRAFEEADAGDFFGRADLVDELVTRLRRDGPRGRLVLVVGGSGTGKSSVVRAGLLPRVRRGDVPGSQGWFVTTMLPGSSPFKELAECLRRVAVVDPSGLADRLAEDEAGVDRVLRRLIPGDGQLLLVVDQLEELFTLASDQDQRAFLNGVMYAVLGPRQPPAAGGHPARRLLRPTARVPAPGDGRERRDGHDDGDVAGRPRSGHRRTCRARRRTGRAVTRGRARQRSGRRARPLCQHSSTRCTSWPSAVPPSVSSSPRTGSWAVSAGPSPRGPSGSTPRSTTENRSRCAGCSSDSSSSEPRASPPVGAPPAPSCPAWVPTGAWRR